MVLGAPAVPDQTEGDQKHADGNGRETVFGRHFAVAGFLLLDVAVGEIADGELADGEAEAEAEVGEAGLAGVEAVDVLEDVGEGCEEDVHVAVGDGAEEGDEEYDGGEEEELDWA